jgi:hypothetical protein
VTEKRREGVSLKRSKWNPSMTALVWEGRKGEINVRN